jgi:plasmid stabilization system protein ParE
MAEIEWTEEAKYWLQQIHDYIARDNEEAVWLDIDDHLKRIP